MGTRRQPQWLALVVVISVAAIVGAPDTFPPFGTARALAASARSPDDPDVKEAVERGIAFLHGSSGTQPGEGAFIAMTLLKAGVSPDDTFIVARMSEIVAKCKAEGGYKEGLMNYIPAVELMALVMARDSTERRDGKKLPELYRAEIQTLLDFILSKQASAGDWDYLNSRSGGGDTSQTQFAMLALWAAADAGFDVPQQAWEGAATWLMKTQYPDGGFSYHPLDKGQDNGIEHGMTVAGVTALAIAGRFLFSRAQLAGKGLQPKDDANNGSKAKSEKPILERVRNTAQADEKEAPAANRAPELPSRIPSTSLQASVSKGAGWLASKYTILKAERFPLYYVYGLERMAALLRFEDDKFAGKDWYADGVYELLRIQDKDGSFPLQGGRGPNTCFAILFLSKATFKQVAHSGVMQLGDGSQRGRRGLEALLEGDKAEVDEEGKLKSTKPVGPVDELIDQILNKSDNKLVEDFGKKVVEDVFAGKSEELIKQKDKLKRMVAHTNPEVRRTALWALAGCEDLGMVPLMIKALQDENLDVVIEAQNALCMLSRHPRGLPPKDGQKLLPLNPLDDLPEDATDEAKQTTVDEWRNAQIDRWKQWYSRVRPYDQRDDLTDVGGKF